MESLEVTKSKNWYPLDRATYESHVIETITSHFGRHQLVHDATHRRNKSIIQEGTLLLETFRKKQTTLK